MALINCEWCKCEILDTATSCPNCSFEQSVFITCPFCFCKCLQSASSCNNCLKRLDIHVKEESIEINESIGERVIKMTVIGIITLAAIFTLGSLSSTSPSEESSHNNSLSYDNWREDLDVEDNNDVDSCYNNDWCRKQYEKARKK